jgi:hypothetical protein
VKIVVIGEAQAGKSTFARHLAAMMDTEATDTSDAVVACEEARLKRLYHIPKAGSIPSTHYDYERQRPRRDLLAAMGDALKDTFGLTLLADACFAKGDICIGVRGFQELAAVKQKYGDECFVIVVKRAAGSGDPDDNFDIPDSEGNLTLTVPEGVGALAVAARWAYDLIPTIVVTGKPRRMNLS